MFASIETLLALMGMTFWLFIAAMVIVAVKAKSAFRARSQALMQHNPIADGHGNAVRPVLGVPQRPSVATQIAGGLASAALKAALGTVLPGHGGHGNHGHHHRHR